MSRYVTLIVGLAIAAMSFTAAVEASDTCAKGTGARCKVGQTAPPNKPNPGAVSHKATQSPPKGNHKGRDQYTPEQREKMMARAREICRKNYGAPSRVYRIDYKRNTVWCEPPAY
ncbi:MAG: hypothetical protein NTZ54_02695 [Alphaproteobacteria bacterium]|nr:hypothetical protein [Alphaproteobacteria bacterium]